MFRSFCSNTIGNVFLNFLCARVSACAVCLCCVHFMLCGITFTADIEFNWQLFSIHKALLLFASIFLFLSIDMPCFSIACQTECRDLCFQWIVYDKKSKNININGWINVKYWNRMGDSLSLGDHFSIFSQEAFNLYFFCQKKVCPRNSQNTEALKWTTTAMA